MFRRYSELWFSGWAGVRMTDERSIDTSQAATVFVADHGPSIGGAISGAVRSDIFGSNLPRSYFTHSLVNKVR